jgi:hypothetical protein
VPSGLDPQHSVTGRSCIPNAEITVPPIAPPIARLERGFRTKSLIEITNTGDDDLTFTARIVAGADPTQAANFGLVLPENDITDAPGTRNYSVPPAQRCGPGPTGDNVQPVAVSFHADGANGLYGAILRIEGHNATNTATAQWDFPLRDHRSVPVDIALVLTACAWRTRSTRNKMEAALAGAQLLVQMLYDTAPDCCAIVSFSTNRQWSSGRSRRRWPCCDARHLTPAVFAPGG